MQVYRTDSGLKQWNVQPTSGIALQTSAIKGNKTPLEVWSGKKPNVSHLKLFGCMVYAHVPDAQRQKLDKKAVKH